jgi:hypothetical protein
LTRLLSIPRGLRVLCRPSIWAYKWQRRGPVGSDESHIHAATDWLLGAQRAGGGNGYAHSFHLLDGWRPAYPETSGYIIPTLDQVYRRFNWPELRTSVTAASRWLQSIQQSDGSFCDLYNRPQVFDTGQILIGFNYLAEYAPELVNREALARAAEWLCAVQAPDGSFVRYAYNGIPHSYYARVGAALLAAGRILGDSRLHESGLRNLHWTLAQQKTNGFFRHLSFDESPPYLHTMMYVVEGLLDGHAEIGDPAFLVGATRFAERMLQSACGRDRILRSQYKSDWTVANQQKCMTGLAQWAGVCFRIAKFEKGDVYLDEALKTLAFIQQRQIRSSDQRLSGALFGSDPAWGRYMRLALPNWGVKFFIDALLLKTEHNLRREPSQT